MNFQKFLLTGFYLLGFPCMGTGGTIGYEEYITLVSHKLPELRINRIELVQASNDIGQTKGIGDTQVSAGSEINGSDSITSGSYLIDSSSSVLADLGLSKKILYTGTTLSGIISYQYTTAQGHLLSDPKNILTGGSGISVLTASISQPLLKNSFGLNDRITLSDAKLACKIQEYQTGIDNQNVLTSYSTLYFQWLGLIKTLDFLNISVSNAAQSEKQAESQLAAGLIDNDDYQSTKNLHLQYKSSILSYEQTLTSIRTSLGSYFDTATFVPDSKEWDSFLIYAMTNKFIAKDFKDTQSAQKMNIEEQRAELSVTSARNAALPDLSLFGSVYQSSVSGSTSPLITTASSSPEYSAGLTLSLPLENNTARNTLENKKLELESQRLRYAEAKRDYESRLKTLIAEIDTKRGILKNTIERLQALRSMTATQRVKHSQGRISQSTLNDTLIKTATEEISLVDCQYSLITLLFDYRTLIY